MNDLQFIASLSADEARQILQILAREDANLAARIVEMTRRSLKQIDPEEIADSVFTDFIGLEVEEVWARSGKTRNGYVDPGEAADSMIDEIFQPYWDEMDKCQQLGLAEQSLKLCMGLLLGLYNFAILSDSKFKEWAGDLPMQYAQIALSNWKKGAPSSQDLSEMKAFIQEEEIGWVLQLD
ncbi:MAG: hypothetical protein WCK35_25455 [Chloroflexota bacterium]